MEKVKALLYCKKAKPLLWKSRETGKIRNIFYIGTKEWFKDELLNGKIGAECEIETEKILYNKLTWEELEKISVLFFELVNYSPNYLLHISNLKIYDRPLELKDTYTRECNWNKCSKCNYGKDGNIKCCTIDIPLSKAPHNMMWVWHNGERKVLISIKPEWLCKILNGEETIEVRRKVLNCMKEK